MSPYQPTSALVQLGPARPSRDCPRPFPRREAVKVSPFLAFIKRRAVGSQDPTAISRPCLPDTQTKEKKRESEIWAPMSYGDSPPFAAATLVYFSVRFLLSYLLFGDCFSAFLVQLTSPWRTEILVFPPPSLLSADNNRDSQLLLSQSSSHSQKSRNPLTP